MKKERKTECAGSTYSITSSILLLSTNNKTLTLSGVQSALTPDSSFTGRATTGVLLTDASNVFPVAHGEEMRISGI